jgi:hypothetical protein
MEDAEPVHRHIVLERAAEAHFIDLGRKGTYPFRNKTLSSRDSSKSMYDTFCLDKTEVDLNYAVWFQVGKSLCCLASVLRHVLCIVDWLK